jgi:septal ring factor EnvC (AmiA/AmiB activator)
MVLTVEDTLTITECGGDFWCPNGHKLSYTETDADRLRDELARAKTDLLRAREARDSAERSAAAYKGEVTKAKKRAAAALCPCCNRSFVQLRRHLASQHPDYDPAGKDR